MTEKRLRYMRAFLVGSSEFVIDDNETHERLKRYDILDRLNEQHEQIERLKRNFKALDELKCEIAEENEQLKQTNQRLNDELQECMGKLALKR